MSTTIILHGDDGTWVMRSVSAEEVAAIAASVPFTSAVGHSSSAEAITAALGTTVEANCLTARPEPGDSFLCLRLHSRPPEGAILDGSQLEAIGFSWALLSYCG